MMNEAQYGKSIAAQILKKYKLIKPSLDELVYIASENGYDIIDYSKDENLESIITHADRLSIQSYLDTGTAFTYKNNDTKLIFLCDSMTNDEKLYALSHELGHIFCNHFSINSRSVSSVKEEREANEFAHYLLKNNFLQNFRIAILKHKKAAVILTSVMIVILGLTIMGSIINKQNSYYGNFYITTTGNKYHQKQCIHVKNNTNIERLTREQFESGEYGACKTCLPNNDQ